MQKLVTPIRPEQIIEVILRRRWLLIVPFFLTTILGIFLAFYLPKLYESSTLILVQPQKVPSDYVRSVVSTGIESRISTISQQIMSWTNLEKIIKEFKLYSEKEHENMLFEDKIENLRRRISVQVTRAKGDADAFTIAFKGKEPEKVMRVTNALATYFIDENLKVREAQAIGTSNFLDEELGGIKKRVEQVEEELKRYRVLNMGALPEQLDTNLRILDRLQEQHTARMESLRAARVAMGSLEKQIAESQNLAHSRSDIGNLLEIGTENSPNTDPLQKQLAELTSKYTERHPDVLMVKRMIADQKQKAMEEKKAPKDAVSAALLKIKDKPVPQFDFAAVQRIQYEAVKKEIRGTEDEIAKIEEEIRAYQKRVEDTPKREQEQLSLKRDYQNLKETYDSLLGRKLEAEISVNMEKKQKGEQFRVIDPARVPEKPIEPDMKRLLFFTIIAGLGLGGGIIFLLEFFDKSFRFPETIESYLGVPVVATVPIICQKKDISRKRWINAISYVCVAASLISFAGFCFITVQGVDRAAELARRLGLL